MTDPVGPPLPGRAFIRQRWRDVLFLHWRVDPARVAPLLPRGTRPDMHDGATWAGLIGFTLADTEFPPLPPLRRLGTFVEVNVRLYSIDDEGRRGVVFRSLDAAALLPTAGAVLGLGLPYRWATAVSDRRDGELRYGVRRNAPGRPGSRFGAVIGAPIAAPCATATFLTARWGMHVGRAGRTRYWSNAHAPWRLHHATPTLVEDGLLAAAGLAGVADAPPDSALYSPGVTTGFAWGRAITPR